VLFNKYAGKRLYFAGRQKTIVDSHTDALAGPYEDIPINKEAQKLDFEVRVSCYIEFNS
jgi:hypothetical protein